MAKYTEHNFHDEWVKAKASSGLSDKLFKSRLGSKLDQLNTLYRQAMAAQTIKAYTPLAKKHTTLAKTVEDIVDAYRTIVKQKPNNKAAMDVLNRIHQAGYLGMTAQMKDDLRDKSGKLVI